LDPSWKPALSGLWRPLVPWFGYRAGAGKKPGITAIRSIVLSTLLSWTIFGCVLVFLRTDAVTRSVWLLLGVAGLGTIDVVIASLVRDRRLKLDSEHNLASTYIQQFFIGYASANAAVLYGFIGFFLGGGMASYLLGLPFGLAALALVAPSASNIARLQRRIQERGSSISLLASLNSAYLPPGFSKGGTPPTPPG
jgi:hypothetical protein